MGVMAGETEGHRDLGAGGGAATGPASSTRSARVRVLYIPQTDSRAALWDKAITAAKEKYSLCKNNTLSKTYPSPQWPRVPITAGVS